MSSTTIFRLTILLSRTFYYVCSRRLSDDSMTLHGILFSFQNKGKVAAAELAEAKAGDVIKSMEGLVNEAKAKLSVTAKGGK